VDYAGLEAMAVAPASGWRDAAPKQRLIMDLLALRAAEPALFAQGDFRPLPLTGARAAEAFAFTRRHEGKTLLVVCAPLCSEPCIASGAPQPGAGWWGDTAAEGIAAAEITGGAAFGYRLA
jgi:(1->4)-alpha-D-glucan 1-alpha-D-glucosylmutase